jgi:hypothetical protein
MAINDIIDLDFGSRVSALRAVGAALGLSGAQLPAQTMANSQRNYLKWINSFRAAKSLPLLPGLDYSGFVPALDKLLADAAALNPPVNTTLPHIDSAGGVALGNVLSCTNGIWDNAPTSYTWQWRRGGVNIASAITANHTIVALDQGTSLTCQVTATNGGGAGAPAVSNSVAIP